MFRLQLKCMLSGGFRLSFWSGLVRPVEEDVRILVDRNMAPGESITLDVDGFISVGCERPVRLNFYIIDGWVEPMYDRNHALARLLSLVEAGKVRIVNTDTDYYKKAVVLFTPLFRVYGWRGTKTLYEGYISGESYVTLTESGLCMLYHNGNGTVKVDILSSLGWLPIVSSTSIGYLGSYDCALFLSLAGKVRVGYESGYYGYVKVVKLMF